MREDYLEQIEKLRDEISSLSTTKKETELKIEQKVRDADVLEARLSAIDSIIEATALITAFTDRISSLEKENVRLLDTVMSLEKDLEEAGGYKAKLDIQQKQLENFGQPKRIKDERGREVVDKPLTPVAEQQPIEEDIKQVSPSDPIDESLLTVDKKKSQSPDSLQD